MDHPKFIISNQKGESISTKRVKTEKKTHHATCSISSPLVPTLQRFYPILLSHVNSTEITVIPRLTRMFLTIEQNINLRENKTYGINPIIDEQQRPITYILVSREDAVLCEYFCKYIRISNTCNSVLK